MNFSMKWLGSLAHASYFMAENDPENDPKNTSRGV